MMKLLFTFLVLVNLDCYNVLAIASKDEDQCPPPIDFPLDFNGKCDGKPQCVIDFDCPDTLLCCENNCGGRICRKSLRELSNPCPVENKRAGSVSSSTSTGPAKEGLSCQLEISESSVSCKPKASATPPAQSNFGDSGGKQQPQRFTNNQCSITQRAQLDAAKSQYERLKNICNQN